MDRWTEAPLPDGTVMTRNLRNGREMTLPAEVLNAMSYCSRFRTLEEHIDELSDGDADPNRRAAIRSVIRSLRNGGMTLSAEQVCDRIARQDSARRPGLKPILAIITWQRPRPLERLLESIIQRVDPARVERCIVIDDSRDSDAIRLNREITRKADGKAPFDIAHVGDVEMQSFLDRLIAAVPQHEAGIRFLLDRQRWSHLWTCGIARNYSQLMSVGHPLIVFDDDVICDVHEAPGAMDGIDLSDTPRQAEFYSDRQQWPAPATSGGRDPVARHMRCLGMPVADCLRELGPGRPQPESLHHAEILLTDRYTTDSRVLVTECGSLGDPGTGHNQWLTRLSAGSRAALESDPSVLDTALTRRNCWMGRRQHAFTPASNMSQISGSDNRDFLPPYFPFNRVEDRLFGQTVSFVFPHHWSLDQSWCTPHRPMPERTWSERDNDFTLTTHFPGSLVYLPESLSERCRVGDIQGRLRHLAHHYLGLADCPDDRLVRKFERSWYGRRAGKLVEIDRVALESSGAAPAWKNYLERAYRQVLHSSLGAVSPESIRSEYPPLDGTEALAFWKNSWREYAQSLLAWPEIREAARRLLGHPAAPSAGTDRRSAGS